MTAKTSEILAQALDAVKLEGLAARARQDEFHDFLSPHDFPELTLEQLLRNARDACPDGQRMHRIEAVRQRLLNGDFDASKEESDEWAASAEGQDAFNRLVRGE